MAGLVTNVLEKLNLKSHEDPPPPEPEAQAVKKLQGKLYGRMRFICSLIKDRKI